MGRRIARRGLRPIRLGAASKGIRLLSRIHGNVERKLLPAGMQTIHLAGLELATGLISGLCSLFP